MSIHNYILFLFFSITCLGYSQNTNQLAILEKQNAEYKKAKEHYKTDSNPLKVKAVDFLFKNLFIHKTINVSYTDSYGDVFEFNEFDYDDMDLAFEDLKCFKKAGGRFKLNTAYDIKNIDANFIIKVVDSSFKAWENSPWKESYSFETFCEYILPYRNAIEPVKSNWKDTYYNLYQPIIEKAEDPKDPVSVCTSLLQEMDYFGFLKNRLTPEPALSVDQIHFRKKGTCTDLASLAVLNARAIGLAVTYDFTPYNAASSNAHFWNTIIDKEGNHIPFNSNLDLPYVYNANYRRLGKVLRRTFSVQKGNITEHISPARIPESRISEYNLKDVTSEYVTVSNIKFAFNEKVLDNVAYITVFNKGKWRILWWGKVDGTNNATFTNMGRNIVYLPAKPIELTKDGKTKISIELERYPIWLNKKGEQQILKPNFEAAYACTLSRENEEVGPYRDFNTVELINGQQFNLYYWDKEWKLITQQKVENNALTFNKLPKNALFKLTPEQPDGFERVFTVDNRNCKMLWF